MMFYNNIARFFLIGILKIQGSYCPTNFHSCNIGGSCKILSTWLCDGEVECSNGADEANCDCPTVGKEKIVKVWLILNAILCIVHTFYSC